MRYTIKYKVLCIGLVKIIDTLCYRVNVYSNEFDVSSNICSHILKMQRRSTYLLQILIVTGHEVYKKTVKTRASTFSPYNILQKVGAF